MKDYPQNQARVIYKYVLFFLLFYMYRAKCPGGVFPASLSLRLGMLCVTGGATRGTSIMLYVLELLTWKSYLRVGESSRSSWLMCIMSEIAIKAPAILISVDTSKSEVY